MKPMWQLVCLAVLATVLSDSVQSAKILGVFPTSSRSHYIVGSALMKALAKKGHQVTVISPFPQKKPLENYRDITTIEVLEAVKPTLDNILSFVQKGIYESIKETYKFGHLITNSTMNDPAVVKLIDSNEKFDLVVLEMFMNDAMLGFAHHFKTPCVAMSTFGASKWTSDLVGNPSPPSYVPNPFLSFTDHMSFGERLVNTLMSAMDNLIVSIMDDPVQVEIYQKSFPDPKPALHELKKNAVSVVLLNNHFSISYPRPYVTGMIEVGGMHVNRVPNPLPANIKAFMDNATDGVIYFSMGSNIKSKDLPIEKRDAILQVFLKLKQKVLWKWEDENLPSKPANVLIQSWWPQDDILAHPNVRLFITHGGLLSTIESLYHGVPVIGIPVFGDQHLNMAKAERGGYGLAVGYKEIGEERLSLAINTVLNDPKFTENAKTISKRYRDQPQTPLELAVFWVEYVIRHNGAPHIRTASMDLSFMQYHNLDVLGVLLGVPILVIYLLSRLIARVKPSKSDKMNDRKKRN
ncbi:UDP-glycosyltransferase UGT5-like [Toxorhynchites rutilus septentrionalis]|uniref:UDP-glycosyltransferase UGT5-like n=1 Tax=Toxorhynchites rutilus septentrionalis TaxID=329112 RepID=UPI00247AF4B8|nr:UDP-glycosyltransferase UGT5-like [Toxorhynchites rutilus septentrionalis]